MRLRQERRAGRNKRGKLRRGQKSVSEGREAGENYEKCLNTTNSDRRDSGGATEEQRRDGRTAGEEAYTIGGGLHDRRRRRRDGNTEAGQTDQDNTRQG